MGKRKKDRDDADEPIEGNIPDRPEGDDFDVDITIEIASDEDEEVEDDMRYGKRSTRGSGWEDLFGADGVFGREGPFGPNGPFGPDGPFGRSGPFGDGGPFGASFGTSFGGRSRSDRRDEMRDRMRRARRVRAGAGRAKRMFAPGELRLVLLLLIADKPRHGYELIKDIEEMTGGSYTPSPGAVYPTLQMLADEGMIEEAEAEGAKKPFQATKEGLAELADRKDDVEDLMERLAIKGKRARDARSPDLFRAMGNLAAVLKNKASEGKLNKASTDEIVDIIDEVAKRIERL